MLFGEVARKVLWLPQARCLHLWVTSACISSYHVKCEWTLGLLVIALAAACCSDPLESFRYDEGLRQVALLHVVLPTFDLSWRQPTLTRKLMTGCCSRKAVAARSTFRESPMCSGWRLCWYPSHTFKRSSQYNRKHPCKACQVLQSYPAKSGPDLSLDVGVSYMHGIASL